MARQYHPDVNPGDAQAEAKFKEINEAHEVLGDPDKRSKYDRLGADWQKWDRAGRTSEFDWSNWAGGSGGRQVNFEEVFGSSGDFSDFFRTIFSQGGPAAGGRGGFQQRSQAGQDVEHSITISLHEAYHGTVRRLSKDGRQLEVKIPAGAKTDTRVRMRGEGQAGFGGGSRGDLYLNVTVSDSPPFERLDDDLQVTVATDLYTAILGGEVRVPTLSGDLKLKIPAGSQNGQSFRLRNKGMPKLRQANQFGDLYARLEVQLPKTITDEQRDLFEKLRAMEE